MSDRERVSSALTRAGIAAAVIAGAMLMVGCTSNPVQPVPGATESAPATPVPDAGGETPTPEPSVPTGIPVTVPCDQLVTQEEMFEFDQNFSPAPDYAPQPDSITAEIVALQGVSCGWLQQTSNETIEVAVAHLDPTEIEARKNALILSSNSVPTYGGVSDEGYFDQADGVGRADVFIGDFWLVTVSKVYFEPGDAEQIVRFAAAALD